MHLARIHGEVEPAQDRLVVDSGVEIIDLEH
jgi:hypothetical protein